MSTDYVGLDIGVLMKKSQVFDYWGEPEVLLRIPTSSLTSASVPKALGGNFKFLDEPITSFYPAAGEGGINQFKGTTFDWSDNWIIPLNPIDK